MAALSIRIPEEIGEQLEKPAASTGRSRSFPALDVLRRYLAQEEWQTQAVRTAVEKADSGTTKYASHDAVDHWPAGFGAQPEGTGPFFRGPALPIAYVRQVHGAHGALPCTKMATVAGVSIVLTGPKPFNDSS